ncbi:MAG: class I adenylate-forming enzyme family protein [Planctomycetota bacterium]|jgi:long-chain acyl-CoA synthetase
MLEGVRIDPARQEHTFTRLFEVCAKVPDRTALVFLGTRFTFGELRDAIDRFATALHRLDVGHQDRVMLYLPNTPQWVIANFAVQRLGAVVVPVSPIYTARELRFMVADAGVETIICLDTNFGYVHETLAGTSLRRIIVTTLTEMLPAWKRAAGHLMNRTPTGKVAWGRNIYSFGKLLKHSPSSPPEIRVDPWRDLASILYTGGTTAFPKGVPGNHMTEVSYVRNVMDDVFGPHMREGEDPLLMVTPLYHIMPKGFFIAAGLNFGNPTVLMPTPHTDAMLREIERHGVRWLLGVPTLYRRMLENDRIDRYRLDSLRYCYCGGDVLPTEVFHRWKELSGVPIFQVYGSTEVGHVAYSRLDLEPRPDVIGRPLDSYRCMVADPDTLEPVAPGEVGELLVTADFTFKTYWNQPDETARCYVEIDGDIFYRMGDFVAQDENGEIRFVERTADIIKHKAFRVSASEVEAVLQDHPTVVGACVVGVEDERVGERIKAIVVLKESVRGVSGGELKAWCRERLARYKVPDYIEFRDMLPKSKVGKLLRREIRDEERRKAGTQNVD